MAMLIGSFLPPPVALSSQNSTAFKYTSTALFYYGFFRQLRLNAYGQICNSALSSSLSSRLLAFPPPLSRLSSCSRSTALDATLALLDFLSIFHLRRVAVMSKQEKTWSTGNAGSHRRRFLHCPGLSASLLRAHLNLSIPFVFPFLLDLIELCLFPPFPSR